MDFWEELGRPRFVCAPMVDQSWLPFRKLVHKRGVELSFTPMAHAKLIVEDEKYRKNILADLEDSLVLKNIPKIYGYTGNFQIIKL